MPLSFMASDGCLNDAEIISVFLLSTGKEESMQNKTKV